MAELPVRKKALVQSHTGKRRSRNSTIGDTEKPEAKRPRSRSAPSEGSQSQNYETSDEETGALRVNLYDAVAGRVGYEGLLLDKGGKPLPPDHVLYNRADAPVRYAETDQYFAHRHLPTDQRLPDSDLLKAIHAYAADFYGSGALGDCAADFRSLDETALIAFGILVEELANASLEDTGDLAFVEDLEILGKDEIDMPPR